ncbi:2-succinyl-5-enolpyruvyl-6-hydroxy-3-cyclohexene-1-carboxylate synthase [Campylobacter blaseri]|uniref:2-succinyl-5-enolpyruvyl-6-hydroxy-3-cyclohexene-1-carboxylate synthase n=1 Tax=Campylobacter blaseri TaxID=2042961 RepID=A0A2P8QZJ9_9BACT|nr:2-succinyl-5-enolpyruvyl-6-hydroxy-3-cyclohexene-1-carboxylic-acid synthase [Campylobacter blaseri]PSM51677.1 2-succinyl-5-enolpyruvyl-6-hydroxy-3-cyclohexene-1-carboxylic-acid synthase [Campylobacter blaseri]PSM53467.1 2-succinyl-5-enolpyruvyl-6-hydroxy-3-cyclohexene-1-carboxylic-acid synthase [Campylobacter blaseri]QKF86272.1 2-succinyl-5-enolpyruvyl-6-hydroxy-3-cyclohexene-1-carboxylate synthase [Campylobacter blaseri]
MISDKKQATLLVGLLRAYDIKDVVISSGSRNGPFIHTFSGCDFFDCKTIVDERSAGYFALGLARASKKPVVLVCSSGTATLNYAPSIAEAYYQKVPLIVITADRPNYYISQMENQCLNQDGIYNNFILKSVVLPLQDDDKALWYSRRKINELLSLAILKNSPVHFNVPFEEPLHNLINEPLSVQNRVNLARIDAKLDENELAKFRDNLNKSSKILIIAGQNLQEKSFESLKEFAKNTNAIILGEHLANLEKNDNTIWQVDLVVAKILNTTPNEFKPDLLITFEGQVISKNIKKYLKTFKPKFHYHISNDDNNFIDTYEALSDVLPLSVSCFFRQIKEFKKDDKSYLEIWKKTANLVEKTYQNYLKELPFCDMSVYSEISKMLPKNSIVHLGNSSPIRYMILNKPKDGCKYLSNRGVSGIDGSFSSAVGYASKDEKINTVILGDLSFLYDSNAMWNGYLKENLKIILVNNGGGNIFGFLEQLENSPSYEKHFFAKHNIEASGFAKTFGLSYAKATNLQELKENLYKMYNCKCEKPQILEVFTNPNLNTKSYKNLYKKIKGEKYE